jgi:NAD dependent epimerase/dehydratase
MKNKILITGAGGFIGSHLTESLLKKGYQIKALVRYNSKNNWGWLEEIKDYKNLEVIIGDIRDYDCVLDSLRDCHSVFHLAALIGIPYSYVSPLAYIKTNIEGTYNIIEAARKLELKKVIITSTSETYGTAQYLPMDEKHPLVGQSPYSASKISADELALSYYRSFDLPVKIVRPFNTYGPRQSARAIIPSIIIQLLKGKGEISLGNISPIRDFSYILDTLSGFEAIYESESYFGEVMNIGSGQGISIKELYFMICDMIKIEPVIINQLERVRPEKSEVQNLICDNAKIKLSLGWENAFTLEDGLIKTIDWIKRNQSYYKDNIYNI